MDEKDHKIISELRHNSRVTYSVLAASTGLSRVTVRARVERLVNTGVILGFTITLKEDLQKVPIRGMTMLSIEGTGTDRVKRVLAGMPDVHMIHSTIGKWDLIVEVGTNTVEELDKVLNQIRRIPGITSSETNFLLTAQTSQEVAGAIT